MASHQRRSQYKQPYFNCGANIIKSLFILNISSQEAQDILDKKDEPSSSVEASSAQSPKRASPISKEQRKILTPKGTVTNPFKLAIIIRFGNCPPTPPLNHHFALSELSKC